MDKELSRITLNIMDSFINQGRSIDKTLADSRRQILLDFVKNSFKRGVQAFAKYRMLAVDYDWLDEMVEVILEISEKEIPESFYYHEEKKPRENI